MLKYLANLIFFGFKNWRPFRLNFMGHYFGIYFADRLVDGENQVFE